MKDSSREMTQLCEAWWQQLATSTKLEQQRYAGRFLGLLGWEPAVPFSPREAAESLSAAPYILRTAGQMSVAAYFLMPGVLEPPSAVRERGLDFCVAARRLVEEARAVKVTYALVTDLYRSYLYDVRTDELLLHADTPALFNGELAPALSRDAVERGALEEVRREPRSVVARQLREWREGWTPHIASQGGLGAEAACLAVDRLLTVRYLYARNILKRTRYQLQQRFDALVARAAGGDDAKVGQELTKLFHDMWLDWRMDLFEAMPALDAVLGRDAVAGPLLREFALLSRGKFSIAAILESFNCGEPDEKMRVRMVPDANEDREHYLSKQTLETIDAARVEVDLAEEGYRAIFHWIDRVIGLYQRLEVDFDAQAQRQQTQPEDLDLFAWSEIDASRPNACADKIAHACEQGFRVYFSNARQFRVARLLLTLHLINRYDQTRQTVERFPALSSVLVKRPLVLPSDRVRQSAARGAFYGADDLVD